MREEAAYAELRRALGGEINVYYRRRIENAGRKAGNIEDWVKRFGGGYDVFVILDGDSIMSGVALVRLARAMEADPTADISGADAAHKLSILAYHAFGIHVPPSEIATTGIEGVTVADVEEARAGGRTIKLVAEALFEEKGLRLSVAPRAIPQDDPLASVTDEVNIVEVVCRGIGAQRFTGKGAGSIPTANAVVSDLLDLLGGRRYRRQRSEAPCLIPSLLADCPPRRLGEPEHTTRTDRALTVC